MDQAVSGTDDETPWDVGRLGLQLGRDMRGGFAENLEKAGGGERYCAASCMCNNRTRSSCSAKLNLGLLQNPIAEVRAQARGRVEINAAAEEPCEFFLQRDEPEARHVPRLEFDQHINIGLGAKVLAQHGAEERQPPDMMTPAECAELFRWH
jgi:hypothetical protein